MQYRTAVSMAMPLLIVVAAALIVVLNGPAWRAELITTIALVCVVMLVDSNASARLEAYRQQPLAAASLKDNSD